MADEHPPFHTKLQEMKRQYVAEVVHFSTLQLLCIKTIKSHSQFFLNIKESTGLNPFNSISNPLKTGLLMEIGKSHYLQGWSNWEKMLVNETVTSLKLSMDPADEESIKGFRSSLDAVQFKLKEFECRRVSKTLREKLTSAILPLGIITSTQHFTDLQKLCLINFSCKDQHMGMIANHLNQLRILKLSLCGVSARGISALSALQHLKEFTFNIESGPENGNTLYNLCLQLLPQLLVAGHGEVDIQFLDAHVKCGIDNEEYTVNFQSLPRPTELCIRQLVLHENVGVIPQGITMPNLTSLYLCDPLKKLTLDDRFSKVTELGLMELGMGLSLRILKRIGHQIRRLLVFMLDRDLVLDRILRLCPNLEELYIPMSPSAKVTFTSPLHPDADLQNLKVLRFKLANYYLNRKDPTISPGVLVQLLSAPNLQWVRLHSVDIDESDAAAIVERLQEGKILQRLEKFEVVNFYIQRDFDFDLFKQELRDRYDNVIENMVRRCPCLRSFYEAEG